MSAQHQTSAIILPFIRPLRTDNRMTFRDRMAAMEWQSSARSLGYTRVAYDTSASDDEPELGDFMLIYAPGAQWATWGVGCCEGGFIVWRPADGATVSWHPSISRALSTIPPAVAEEG
jgi:hypothetical protein